MSIHCRTPLHTDVFGSFSWSANICGTKKWLIIPPGNESKLKSLNNNQMPHNFYSIPNFYSELQSMNGLEVIQNSGEIIYIPSGYIHQVINTEDTISINHNWFNATNINIIFDNIVNALNEVENELKDLKTIIDSNEWSNECQTLLKLHFGMNLNEFFDCLRFISERIRSESLDKHFDCNKFSFRIKSERNSLLKLLVYIKSKELLNFKKEINRIENNMIFK